MSEQEEPLAVKVDLIDRVTFKRYLGAASDKGDLMSFSDWAKREEIILLKGINSKLDFFVLLIILGMILSFFQLF